MALRSLLQQSKAEIVRRWFDLVATTYPEDTARFLRSQSDPFANPVGQTTIQGLEALFDLLVGELDLDAARRFLDPIVRIRAVQPFSPTEAVGFVFQLKTIVRETMTGSRAGDHTYDQLLALEDRIDRLGLLAFDLYMGCRETVWELRANEMRDRTYRAFARAGLVAESTDDPS